MTDSLIDLTAGVKAKARALGFDACGVAPATKLPELAFFREWLSRGYAGTMSFLERSAEQRSDVRHALPSAQSVIVTATLYNTDRPYSIECEDAAQAHVARYAWGEDYHDVLMRRLDALVGWMHAEHPAPFEAAPYVDTGPVQERVFAKHAGIGWIGKNCCVIHPRLGSFIFLAEILCSLPLAYDEPSFDQCGACSLCIDACPTQALVGPGVLDASRCISYLTIEHRGDIDPSLHEDIGTRVYGCDVCQEVCPWNGGVAVSADGAWQPRPAWDAPSVKDLVAMSDETMQVALRRSSMKRAKAAGLRRNVAMAQKNIAVKGER